MTASLTVQVLAECNTSLQDEMSPGQSGDHYSKQNKIIIIIIIIE